MTTIKKDKQSILRDILGGYMEELGNRDDRVVVVNADLMGTCRNRSFVERYPERSFNVGIAEQNLVSFAAGLAKEGFRPYVFSMAPFLSMRACEQCRTDVAYGNLNICLMATYAGLSGGISGATHWSMEDCGIMCSIPNMTVLEACDEIQAKRMLEATLSHNGPVYIRSSVEPMIGIYDEKYRYRIGEASTVVEGDDGAFLCAGVTVKYAVEAAERIKKKLGKAVRVVDMHTIKPLDRQAVREAAKTGAVIAAHDHNVYGGLGTWVAQVMAEENLSCRYGILGIPDQFAAMAHAPYLYHKFGYDADGLLKAMEEVLA